MGTPFGRVAPALLQKWAHLLKKASVPDVETSLREIEKFVCMKIQPSMNCASVFEELCDRRANREPLQYVLGEWDFRYLTLKMKSPVFIPRPETEGLIDLVNDDIEILSQETKDIKVFEVGVGSGAISLSLLNENTNVHCVGIDCSGDAIQLAGENADLSKLKDRLQLHHGPVSDISCFRPRTDSTLCDILVSNPPYIPSSEIKLLQPEIIAHESRTALDGGLDGLDTVRDTLQNASSLLKPGGLLWFEVDSSHPLLIRKMITANPELSALRYISTHLDYCEKPRFCKLSYEP